MCCPNMDTKYYPLVRLSGTLGDHELGVQTVLSTLDTVTYSIVSFSSYFRSKMAGVSNSDLQDIKQI